MNWNSEQVDTSERGFIVITREAFAPKFKMAEIKRDWRFQDNPRYSFTKVIEATEERTVVWEYFPRQKRQKFPIIQETETRYAS